MDVRRRVQAKIDELTEAELEVLETFVDAQAVPVETELLDESWLTTPAWSEAFVARLRAHHALNSDPLSTTAFEGAFNASCRVAGWEVEPAQSATNRFFDTTLTGSDSLDINLSLKTSSARDMKRHWVLISKLTEAAWIQDARRQTDRRDRIVDLFEEYAKQTDAIIMLRAFRQIEGGFLYELIEIPTGLFEPVGQLTVPQAQHGTIPIPPGSDAPYLKIRIDQSDAKITLTSIQLDHCFLHGRWLIPDILERLGEV